jgi:hypothetical protein
MPGIFFARCSYRKIPLSCQYTSKLNARTSACRAIDRTANPSSHKSSEVIRPPASPESPDNKKLAAEVCRGRALAISMHPETRLRN